MLSALVIATAIITSPICPDVNLECLPAIECISNSDMLREAGAPEWAVLASEGIRSGNIGKKPFDVIKWRNGNTDLGLYHINHDEDGEDVLGMGLLTSDGHEGDWVPWAEALLYWDYARGSYSLQYNEWYGIIDGPVNEARRSGCRRRCLAVVAGIANSSPTLARQLGRETTLLHPLYSTF